MTFGELQTMFESITGTSGEVDSATLAIWFNEAQLDIALSAGNGTTHTYTGAVAGTAYALPSDCLRVLDSDVDYTINAENKIVFDYDDDAEITYRAYPAVDFTGASTSQVSDLPKATHGLFVRWAASRYWDMESEGDTEESNHAIKWMQEYERGKAQILRMMNIGGNRVDRWTVV